MEIKNGGSGSKVQNYFIVKRIFIKDILNINILSI